MKEDEVVLGADGAVSPDHSFTQSHRLAGDDELERENGGNVVKRRETS